MFEGTIHIPGLQELAEAIREIAKKDAKPQVVDTTTNVVTQMPAPMQTQQVPVQQPVTQVSVQTQQVPVQQPVQTTQTVVQAPVQMPQQQVQTSTQTYVLDDISKAAMTLMDAGRQQELLLLLNQFGVESLPALPQEQYGAFATALRGMGAHI